MDEDEVEYETGRRRALLGMLSHVLRELGISDPEAGAAVWVAERLETIQKLREVCGEHGDNDWPDDLHLGDVIEKHLARYLSDEAGDRDRIEAPLCNHSCPNSSKYMCTLFPNHLGGHRAFDRVTGSVIDWPASVREEEAEE